MGSKWEIFPCGEMVCDPPNVCWRPKKYDVPLEMCLPPGFSFDALPERLCFERAAIYIFAFWHTIAALAVGALLAMLVWCLFSRRRRQIREFVRHAPGRMTRRLQEAVDHLRRRKLRETAHAKLLYN
jgi:hypothetical protein